MRIVMLGAPGAGKGTQAQFIMKKYGIPQISSGEMLRTAVRSRSELGKKVKDVMNSSKLVADELVISLIKERIIQKDCLNGFLLDGFPRTISQANAIKKIGININYVLEFDIPDKIVINRVVGRRIHMASGRIYHIKFNPPKIDGRDDLTGEELTVRKDDQEDIAHRRLIEYHKMTEPLINYYKKEAKTGYIKYIRIDATRDIVEVHKDLEKILI